MANSSQDAIKSRPFEPRNGNSRSTKNTERYSVLIKSFLSTVGSDVLRSLLTETAEKSEGSIEEFLYKYQTSIIYFLQNRMRNKLDLVFPPDDIELDLNQWNCRLLCLVLRATDCLHENLLDDVNFIERAYTKYCKAEVTLMKRSLSSYGKQLQPKKEWTRVCVAVQRLAEHVGDSRLISSVRNFICKAEMGTKVMDARVETHLSLSKMISELAASHSDYMSAGYSDYSGQLGELTKIKQQYDMVSKPSFSETRCPNSLSRTMVIDGEPTRPISSRDRELSDKPSKSAPVTLLSTECIGDNRHENGQMKRTNSSESITIQNQTLSPPKRHRPFSSTSTDSLRSRSVKLITPRLGVSKQSGIMNDENNEGLNSLEHPDQENAVDTLVIGAEKDNQIVDLSTNGVNDISDKRLIKSASSESRNTGKMLKSRNSHEIHHNSKGSVTRLRSFDISRNVFKDKLEIQKKEEKRSRGDCKLFRNTVPSHNPNSTKARTNDVVQIYTKSLKLPSKEKTHNDQTDRNPPTDLKPDLRTTIAERQEKALKLIQESTFSSLMAYTMRYQRPLTKKKLPANTTAPEKVDKIEHVTDELPLEIDQSQNDKVDDIIEEKDSSKGSNENLKEVSANVIDKLPPRRKSTFGRLKDLFKNALLPNKHGSESISSHTSSGTLSSSQTPADSFSSKAQSKPDTFEQLLSTILPKKTALRQTQSDGNMDNQVYTDNPNEKRVGTKSDKEVKIDSETSKINKDDSNIAKTNKIASIKIDTGRKMSSETENVSKFAQETANANVVITETTKTNEIGMETIKENQTATMTSKIKKMDTETTKSKRIITEIEKDNKTSEDKAKEPALGISELKDNLEGKELTNDKSEVLENREGSVKELKKNTRVKFSPNFEQFSKSSSSHGKKSFDNKRKRRQSLPLITYHKSDNDLLDETSTDIKSQSMVVSRQGDSMTAPTRRRASIPAASMRELSNLLHTNKENDLLGRIEDQHNEVSEKSNDEKGEQVGQNKEIQIKRDDILRIGNNSKPEIKKETQVPTEASTEDDGSYGRKQKGKAKHLANRRKSIAVSALSSSVRVGNNINRPKVPRSNSESEINMINEESSKSYPNAHKLHQNTNGDKIQEAIGMKGRKSVMITNSYLTSQSSKGKDTEQTILTLDSELMSHESKSKLPDTQKPLLASSFTERQLDLKKENASAQSESEFNMPALTEENRKKESECTKNQTGKKTNDQNENSKQKQNSLLDGAVLYEDDAEISDNSSNKSNEDRQSFFNEGQKISKHSESTTEKAEIAHEKSPGKDEVKYTKLDNDDDTPNSEPVEDPEAEMKKIANDVIVHRQVHKAAREFMNKDKEFVDKFFTFLHKYQATKEFLKTEQYSPFKTMKLPTGIKAALSFIHAFTFRHVNVFDRDQCYHVVEKILKRTECEDAKRLKKEEQEIIKRITDEMKLENQKLTKGKDDGGKSSRKSKNKGKANKSKGKDAPEHPNKDIENKQIESLLKDLQKLETCHCWKCRQKDLTMTIAVNWRNHGICDMLLKYGVQFKIEHLLPAVRANDGENVKEIVASLKRRYAWDASHEEARMALILARFHNMQDIVNFLEKEGVQDERVVQCACFA